MKMRASLAIVLSLLSAASSSAVAINNEIIAGDLSGRDTLLNNSKRTPVIVFPNWSLKNKLWGSSIHR